MGLQANSAPLRNNQANTGTAESTLTTAGDILINNNLGQLRRLPIGAENFQLTVDNGQATWKRSTGELYKVSYHSIPVDDYWDATWGATGVPFNQTSLSRYNHAEKFYANLKYVENTGSVLTKSTSAQGGYNASALTLYKANCQELWCTINTDDANLDVILDNLGTTGSGAIDQIVAFVEGDAFSGIDIQLDEPASLGVSAVNNLNTWLGDLKTALNNSTQGASLQITLPALSNATIAGNYNFDYGTFASNVDLIGINCCCAHTEFGYGYGTTPYEMLIGGVYDDVDMCITGADEQGQTTFYEGGVLQKYATDNSNNNMQKLVVILPNDGWANDESASNFTFDLNLTRNQINLDTSTYNTNIFSGRRDSSGELRWFTDTHTFTFCDGEAMRRKAEVIRQWLNKWELDYPLKEKPIYNLAFKYMGGNNFSYFE